MHPQLSDKRIVCKDLIQALDECHLSGWKRLTGGCNKAKDELNQCLHAESMKRASRNREMAKQNRTKVEKGWGELHQDD